MTVAALRGHGAGAALADRTPAEAGSGAGQLERGGAHVCPQACRRRREHGTGGQVGRDRGGQPERRTAQHPARRTGVDGEVLPGPPPGRTGADRTSVVLRLDNVPGALVSALTEFAIRDIDLTRIESRPTRKELGTYFFFLDCVGHIDDEAVAEALKALHRRCADVRFLGSWPTGAAAGAAPPRLDEASRWLTQRREGKP